MPIRPAKPRPSSTTFAPRSITEKVWGPNHPYLAVVRNQLAEFYLQEGRDADAEPLCQQALETSKAVFGEKHPSVANALSTCGKLEVARGDLRTARTDFQAALAIRQEVFGEDHPKVACSMGDLAALCSNPGDYAKGVALYQRAIEMTDQRLGLDHPQVARLLKGLAALYVGQGMYAEAEPCLKRALAVEEATLVPFHLDLADTLDTYADLLLKLHPSDANRSSRHEEASHADSRKSPGRGPDEVGRCLRLAYPAIAPVDLDDRGPDRAGLLVGNGTVGDHHDHVAPCASRAAGPFSSMVPEPAGASIT